MQSPSSKHHIGSSDNHHEEHEIQEGKDGNPPQQVKEGQEKEGLNSEAYPQPGLKDKQYDNQPEFSDNQPEFIDRNANDKSKS